MFPKNLWQSIIVIILIYVCIIVGVISTILLKQEDNEYLLSLINVAIIVILIAIVGGIFNKGDLKKITPHNSNINLSLIILIILFAVVLYLGLSLPIYLFIKSFYVNDLFRGIQSVNLFSIITICFIVPFFEEFLFKNIILKNLLLKNSDVYSIILCTLIFTCSHPNFYNLIPAAILSVITCIIYIKSKNFLLCFVFHAFYNLSYFILIKFYLDYLEALMNEILNITIVLLLLNIISFILFSKLNQKLKKDNDLHGKIIPD
jgi:membrane protease YdiL (CAAX protease family)